ncbi:DNA packaging terminase subunit 3 [Anguillid herpesvirus 1]|nr:DNA packaging terminase subunit 3 [Anguillid herpesvirus 1]
MPFFPLSPIQVASQNFFLNQVPLSTLQSLSPETSRVVIGMDPTWSNGTLSAIGICTCVHTITQNFPKMIVVGVDEIEIGEYSGEFTEFYSQYPRR